MSPVELYDGVLYHVTPRANVEAIRQNGFRPTPVGCWGNVYDEPRTYFLQDSSDTEAVAADLILRFGVKEVAVLEIDVKPFLQVPFFEDPDWEGDSTMDYPAVYASFAFPASVVRREVGSYDASDFCS